jgi:2-polyprenyl-6-methoxyphenol hydroxylase-like FAD-dependent oxidoreductase
MTIGPASETSAVVAGGGIGGLATAIGLLRNGWSVTVLERATQLREVGAGWSFAPNALRAVDWLGLGKEFRAISLPSHAGATLRTPDGTYLMRFQSRRDFTVLANHRAELHHLLAAQLPKSCICTGAQVSEVGHSDQRVTVTYRIGNGPREISAALLVGADGIGSAVRKSVFPEAPAPVFQRILCWRGVTKPGSVWPIDGFQTWGRGARFGAHPLPGERVFWFLAVRQSEPGQRYDDDLAEVVRRTNGWHAPIPSIVHETTPESVLCHDIYDLDALASYVDRRVCLLGDAAHAMTPFLAQGACQAFEDATVLCTLLANDADVPTALAAYDRLRKPRSQRVVTAARSDPKLSLSTSALTYRLMTSLTRLASSRIGRRKTAWLWSWTPPTTQEELSRTSELP